MAGFHELEVYGIRNILPDLVIKFGMSRDSILRLSLSEVYMEIQRISNVNFCTYQLNQIAQNKIHR